MPSRGSGTFSWYQAWARMAKESSGPALVSKAVVLGVLVKVGRRPMPLPWPKRKWVKILPSMSPISPPGRVTETSPR
jgi:hypothetical protein